MNLTANRTYVSQVTDLLKLEAEAITSAARQLQPSQIEQAIQLLVNCRGKVVVSGVGKSGIVARKIAATMTSTGTLATYLHPGDALHGDLGIVTGDDVAILLSNSGETDEIVAMLPYLHHREVPIIAILGNLNSTLARRADAVLDASVAREACPLNLAPTASTTVALAIGDAIAMTLMQAKGLTPEDFAQNHPAGRLGKRLTLRVQDLMHGGTDNPTIAPQSSWLEVVGQISQRGLGAVNVVDAGGRLLGVITDGDLRRAIQSIEPQELDKLYAGKIMTRNPSVVLPLDFAYDALQLMENRPSQISVLPVVDEERMCLGLIRLHDIVRCGI
jgi:arabinose-5-phosphate isomerase